MASSQMKCTYERDLCEFSKTFKTKVVTLTSDFSPQAEFQVCPNPSQGTARNPMCRKKDINAVARASSGFNHLRREHEKGASAFPQ